MKTVRKKNSLFLKKFSVRFFQKQAVFFRERPPPEKMHIYAFVFFYQKSVPCG
jgi:hypothetical protein